MTTHRSETNPEARRFRAYNVGLAKTGTTSVWGICSQYRAAHEFMFRETTEAISDYRTGVITKETFVEFLRQRDRAGNLEMDSSSFNFAYLDILRDEFPDARFIATVRDCYSWLDSLLNMFLSLNTKVQGWMYEFGRRSFGVPIEERMITSRENLLLALPEILDGLLGYWSRGHNFILENAPPERSLIIRTEEISRSAEMIAEFLGVPVESMTPEHSHLYKAQGKFNLLSDFDIELLEDGVEQHCSMLMKEHFPDSTLQGFISRAAAN
jgi:hypothetical protein